MADSLSFESRYQLLREICELLLSDLPDSELLAGLADRIIESSDADGAVLTRLATDGRLDIVTARSYRKRDIEEAEFEVSKTLIKKVFDEDAPVFVENVLDLPSLSKSLRTLKVLSVIALPLRQTDAAAPYAVLYLDRRRPGHLFCQDDMEVLSDILGLANRTLAIALRARRLDAESASLPRGGIVGHSKAISTVLGLVRRAATADANILIRGETGTGKELVAQLAHELSPAGKGPFVAVNCAAIPSDLLESELFGHEAGAFTNASHRRIGRMQEAAGGTIFLDEIGDMRKDLQAKILRVVEARKFRVLGGGELTLDARIIAATHQPLEELVEKGTFRQDLYYRLAVIEIALPPLRDRREDIIELARHFILTMSRLRGRIPPKLTRSARIYLERRDYPGNVRELSHLLQRALVFNDGTELTRADLCGAEHRDVAEREEPLTKEAFKRQKERLVEELEQQFITRLMKSTGDNVATAARSSGFSEVYLYRLLKRHAPSQDENSSDGTET